MITDYINMAEAARYYYQQTGKTLPSRNTVRLWIKEGKTIRRPRGWVLIKLKGVLIGGHNSPLTRRIWVDQFIKKTENHIWCRKTLKRRKKREAVQMADQPPQQLPEGPGTA